MTVSSTEPALGVYFVLQSMQWHLVQVDGRRASQGFAGPRSVFFAAVLSRSGEVAFLVATRRKCIRHHTERILYKRAELRRISDDARGKRHKPAHWVSQQAGVALTTSWLRERGDPQCQDKWPFIGDDII